VSYATTQIVHYHVVSLLGNFNIDLRADSQ
jgi:hypothetical protein